MQVCLVLEGSYPTVVGGVPEWTHQLIRSLPDIEFTLWTITPSGTEEAKYELPDNVVEWKRVSLQEDVDAERPIRGDRIDAWNEVTRFHLDMLTGKFDRFGRVLRYLSGDTRRLNLRHITRDLQGWRLVTFFHKHNDAVNPFSDYYWGWYNTHLPLFKLLEEEVPQADVYHAVSTGYAGLLATLAKLRTGRPFILTEHGIYAREREMEIYGEDVVQGYQRQMWSNVFRGLARIAYHHADLIVSLYERNRRTQIEMGAPEEKTRVIPNGIEVDKYLALRDGRRQPEPHVGLVGRVAPVKDVKTFIMAARVIKDAVPHARFSIIGPTEENQEYFEQCRKLAAHLELNGSLYFLGRQDMRRIYPQLDLLMLTSIKEAQPLVLIEAMCAGVPVVSTNVGDAAELLEPEWPTVPPKEPDALARAALEILQNPESTRRKIETAQRRASQRYDIRKLTEEYASLYRHYGQA